MDTLKDSMNSVSISRKERYSRCIAVEEDYVRQVYEKIGNDLAQAQDPLEDIVEDFLDDLEPGSLVADIGCGSGKHLRDKNGILSIGVDSSSLQTSLSRQRSKEALLGDNLRLPFRGNAFDAVLSIGVIHHFTTRERRIKALMELARILKIGGKVLIAVQRHNTQTSKDVLIPWFDVPNDKNQKGGQLFEENSDEYENEDYRDDGSDEDSISLPSSDEEDTPWLNHAKIFPPKANFAKQDWSSNRQSRSLDNDDETSSSSVPNQKQLVQTNACYSFVRNAFKRFSSVSSAEGDAYIEPECDKKVDLAVPLSPTASQEQRINFSHSSFFNVNERIARTICDNYIELLNFDCGQNTSSSLPGNDSLYSAECEESSKEDTTDKTKGNLIHSLSGIFKNMNSLWSIKGTKSCSDLKRHAVKEGRNALKRKDDGYRLVRSRTIASCKSEFGFEFQLEDVEENDMTINEANKIINDFLESSMPGIETARPNESVHVSKRLTHSDIMNGNTLTSSDETEFKRKYNFNESVKKKYSVRNTIEEENCKEKCDKSLKNNHRNFLSEKKFECILEMHEPCNEIYFLSETISSAQNMEKKRDTIHMEDQCELNMKNNSNSRSELEARLREKYSFLFDDIDNYELSKIKSEDPSFNENTKTNFKSSISDVIDEKECEILHLDNKYNTKFKDINSKLQKMTQKDSLLTNENIFASQTSLNVAVLEEDNRTSSKQKSSFSTVKSSPLKQNIEYEENLNMKSDNCNFESNSLLNKSVKESNLNSAAQTFDSNTLGPFYEENDKCFLTYENPALCSYYSMPELHALSEFYQEYCIYQTDSFYNRIVEPSKVEDSFHEEPLVVGPKVQECNTHFDSNFQNLRQNNSSVIDSMQCEQNITSQIRLDKSDSKKEISLENESESLMDVWISQKEFSLDSSKQCLFQKNYDFDTETAFNQNGNHNFHRPLSQISRFHSVSNLLEISNEDSSEKQMLPIKSFSLPSLYFSADKMLQSNSLTQKLKSKSSLDSINCSSDVVMEFLTPEVDVLQNEPQMQSEVCKENNVSALIKSNNGKTNTTKKSSGDKGRLHLISPDIIELSLCDKANDSVKKEEKDNILNDGDTNKSGDCEYEQGSGRVCRKYDLSKSKIFTLDNSQEQTTFYRSKGENNETCDLSETKTSEEFSKLSLEFLRNCHTGSDIGKNIDREPTTEISKKHLAELELSALKSTPCNFSNNKVAQNSFHEKLPSSSTNISDSKPTCLSCHHLVFFPKNETVNGAKIINESTIVSNSEHHNSFNGLSENSFKSLTNQESFTIPETSNFYSNEITRESDEKILYDSVASKESCINYAYGKINEDGAKVVDHRYHHLFEEDELDELIENCISDLHVLSTFHHKSHWCIIAEKVRVWSI